MEASQYISDKSNNETVTAERYRQVLGQFPTGVTVVTSTHEGRPVGMTIGSFVSISLEPPLVGFCVSTKSATWAQVAASGRFCVNVLGSEDVDICLKFGRPGDERFSDLAYANSAGDCPILDSAIAWIDCEIDSVVEIGDHLFVVGHVSDLDIGRGGSPMLFFNRSLGEFALRQAV